MATQKPKSQTFGILQKRSVENAKEKQNLDFAATREQIQRHIDLWLQMFAKEEEKLTRCEIGSVRWNLTCDAQDRYNSMAHALVMLGREIGVIAANEYPQFLG